MTLDNKNFTMVCDDNVSYMRDVYNYLDSKTIEILSFFGLSNLKKKRRIVIYNDLELYKKHIEEYHEYKDYMCADTNDGNINILSLEAAHQTKEHANMSIDQLKSTILHEFVHICQQDVELEHLDHDIVWFWEALATNLGNPERFTKIEIKATNEEIVDFISLRNNYSVSYTIGLYMLENYSREEIIEYVKFPSRLLRDCNNILNNAREWSVKKLNKNN